MMKIEKECSCIVVSGIQLRDLEAASDLIGQVSSLLGSPIDVIEIDFSEIGHMSDVGIASLFDLYKEVERRQASTRLHLLNPRSSVRRLLELRQINLLFDISQCP